MQRRRSGALHAATCEEYLKKYESIGRMIQESNRKKSQSADDQFRGFDFIANDPDYVPFDGKPSETIPLKILIYSPQFKINEQEFQSLMKRVRSRSLTTDACMRNSCCYDFDFFYREYGVQDKVYGLHFWVQNTKQNKLLEMFQSVYYSKFRGCLMLYRDPKFEQKLLGFNPQMIIKYHIVVNIYFLIIFFFYKTKKQRMNCQYNHFQKY